MQKQPPMNDLPFLRSIFEYDPDSGELTWKVRADVPKWWNTRYAGTQPLATDALGYRRAKITYGTWAGYVSVHRICYLLANGVLPQVVDHINGVVTDNRKANLRAANEMSNAWNRAGNRGTATGFKGVNVIRYRKGPNAGAICGYTAKLGHGRQREYLGFFKSAEEAAEAYTRRESELRDEVMRK